MLCSTVHNGLKARVLDPQLSSQFCGIEWLNGEQLVHTKSSLNLTQFFFSI